MPEIYSTATSKILISAVRRDVGIFCQWGKAALEESDITLGWAREDVWMPGEGEG